MGRGEGEPGAWRADEGYQGGEGAGEVGVGQRVRVWPNHACVAGAGFGWFLVVDSGGKGGRMRLWMFG